MDCIFNRSDRIKVAESDVGTKFVYSLPTKDSVYSTALNCIGISFNLGHGGFDNLMHTETRNSTERTKTRNQFNGRTFSNAYFGSGDMYPYTKEFESKTNIVSTKSRGKSDIEYRSPIPNQFYYHFENVQRVNPLISGIDMNIDTRMQQRKTLNKK